MCPRQRVVTAVLPGRLAQLLYLDLSLRHHARACAVNVSMLALSMAVDHASALLRRRVLGA